jgi:hypothetical protein
MPKLFYPSGCNGLSMRTLLNTILKSAMLFTQSVGDREIVRVILVMLKCVESRPTSPVVEMDREKNFHWIGGLLTFPANAPMQYMDTIVDW